MSPIRTRAAELAKSIADVIESGRHASATVIGVTEDDWTIICLGLGLVACADDGELEAKH